MKRGLRSYLLKMNRLQWCIYFLPGWSGLGQKSSQCTVNVSLLKTDHKTSSIWFCKVDNRHLDLTVITFILCLKAAMKALVKCNQLCERMRTIYTSPSCFVFSFYLKLLSFTSSNLCLAKLKVALSQKRLEDFYFSKINIPNLYPEQKI